MDSEERSKKRLRLWSRAVVHFSLCFAIGVFAALLPLAATGATSIDSIRASFRPTVAATPPVPELDLLLIVTVTPPGDDDGGMSQEASLTRLGHTLRLVEPPLLWIVVGAENTTATARAVNALRGTRVMFRHLAYAAENFTAPAGDEVDYQMNVALSHIQLHRLPGVVHFAGASSVYDLRFFQQLRQTRGIAAWPIAIVSSADQTVKLEGPTCNSSLITGWYSKDSISNITETTWDSSSNTTQTTWDSSSNKTQTTTLAALDTNASKQNSSSGPPEINMHAVGFKSSMLWDSERFTRRDNSSTGINQDLIQAVRQMMINDEDKKRGIPSDCSDSQIMLWHLDMPRHTPKIEQATPEKESLTKGDEEESHDMTLDNVVAKTEEHETLEKENLMKGDEKGSHDMMLDNVVAKIEEQETPEKENLTKGEEKESHDMMLDNVVAIIEEQETPEKENLTKGDEKESHDMMLDNVVAKIDEQETTEKESLTKGDEKESHDMMLDNVVAKIEEQETPEKESLTKGDEKEPHDMMLDNVVAKIEEQETPEEGKTKEG
uniref:Glycosyltransferases n=1 Tax=Oryza meridionalis TaxID=40149 RepID=A0A0E0BXE2_9ORYZ